MMRRFLTSLASVGVIFATALMLGSCDEGLVDPGDEYAPIQVTAFAIGTPINSIVIEVTADDINNRLVFNLRLEGGIAHGIIDVPIGPARTFTVTAYDDHHNVTHEGSATADVNSVNNPPLHVKLKPVSGEVEINVTFGEYAVFVYPELATIDAAVSTSLQLTVSVVDQYGEDVPNPDVQWATTDPSIATVSTSGLVTGLDDGEATIVATYDGVAGISELTLTGFGIGPTWQPQTSGTSFSLTGVWGSSATDVFAVAALGTILHYDGTAWTQHTTSTTEHLNSVWGSSATDVFAVGQRGTILHYEGTAWSAQTSGTSRNLFGVWGSSATDVYAVGEAGTILHYDGTAWSAQTSGTTGSLSDVWGSSATDVFAVGTDGVDGMILHYDGAAWGVHLSGSYMLGGVWGTSATDIFAIGAAILHYDGTDWSEQTSPTVQYLDKVWGSSAADVFIVGHQGTILHFDGTSWSAQTSGTTAFLSDVWGSSATDVFAVGENGLILHYGTP